MQAYGGVTIEAVGKSSGARGNKIFLLSGNITLITPSIGTVGTWVSITGNGYAASEIIRIDLGTTKTITIATATAGGSFSTRFMVDNQPYGTTTVTAYGNISKQQINGKFKVIQRIANVSPHSGGVGSVITVTGDGYHAGQGIVLSFGSTANIATTVIGANGRFEAVFTVDMQPYGSRSITAIDTEGLVGESSFRIMANISLVSPQQSPVGTTISIEGNGYGTPEPEQILILFANNRVEGPDVWSDANGYFKGNFVVDSQPYGTTAIQCFGISSGANGENYLIVIPKIISITPVSCSVGSVVSIVGAGFVPTAAITIGFGTTPNIGNIVTSDMGTFSLEFTVDIQPYGTTTLVAMGAATNVEEYLNILPRIIMVSPSCGTIGSQVMIMGNGYGASDIIRVDFGQTISICGAAANELGEWTAGFVVDTQVYGNTVISANGVKAGTATGYFTILPELIKVEPDTGTVGTPVIVSGHGYGVSEAIYIRFGNNMEPIVETMTNDRGIFTTAFVVDTQMFGTTTVNAIGQTSSSSAKHFFITPQLYGVAPTSGTIGAAIIIRGNGYDRNDLITIDFGTTMEILKNKLAEDDGSFILSFTASTQVFGTCTIVAKGMYSSSANNLFFVVPQIIGITPTIGTVGTIVILNGNGYIGNEVISVGFGQIGSIATMAANTAGQFSNTFTIGAQPYGTTTVTATGLISQIQANTMFRVTQQVVSISPKEGTIGTNVTMVGNGYGLLSTIRIDLGSIQSIAMASSNVNGVFTSVFTVNLQTVGTKTVTATGLNTGAVSSIAFKIKPNVYLITPTQGTVGTIITLSGNGYDVYETINVDFGTTKIIISFSASTGGTFTRVFTINTQGYGTTTVTAKGVNDEGIRTVMIRGRMTLITPVKGTVGTIITISGTGYGSSETVRVSLGTTVTLSTIQATGAGTFTIIFTANNQPYATNTISVYGISSTENIMAGFAVDPKVYYVYPIAGPKDAT
ncbi:MAG: hypothetical protein AAB296_00115, partial [Candidatus Desantisbacteria bacterium]